MANKKIVKTVAVASLVAISSINLFGCKEKASESGIKIQVEQNVTNGNGDIIKDNEQTPSVGKATNLIEETPEVRVEAPKSEPIKKEEETVSTPIQNEVKQTPPQPQKAVSGADKNGHPYLQPGASYTFGSDGMPIEAPAPGTYEITLAPIVTNPETGKEYQYRERKGVWVDYGEVKERMENTAEWERKVRDGEMTANGRTDLVEMTDEEIRELAERAAAAFRQ